MSASGFHPVFPSLWWKMKRGLGSREANSRWWKESKHVVFPKRRSQDRVQMLVTETLLHLLHEWILPRNCAVLFGVFAWNIPRGFFSNASLNGVPKRTTIFFIITVFHLVFPADIPGCTSRQALWTLTSTVWKKQWWISSLTTSRSITWGRIWPRYILPQVLPTFSDTVSKPFINVSTVMCVSPVRPSSPRMDPVTRPLWLLRV